MNTEVNKSKARDLAAEMERANKAKDARKHEQHESPALPEEVVEVPESDRAMLAIMKNAEATPQALAEGMRKKLISVGVIEKDGCDFIDFTLLFLDYIECPEELRSLIIAICGMTGGDYQKFFPMPMPLIGQRLGIDRKTVGERVKELIKWQDSKDYTIVEVQQHDLDRSKMKYAPNEYRMGVIFYAGEFIRRARSMNLYVRNRQSAIERSIDTNLKQLAGEVESEIPNAQVLRPRGKKEYEKNGFVKNVTPQRSQYQMFRNREQRALEMAVECAKEAPQHGIATHDFWVKFVTKGEEKIGGEESW